MDSGMGNTSLMQQISVDTMKKAMDIQSREILSVLQSAGTMQSPAQPVSSDRVAQLTGVGQRLDVKA